MASSNRHWPSLFKAKPCNSHLQWQHDINSSSLLPSARQKTSYASEVRGCEERSPEPKPRWNPKPEQIQILEAIFNSGMVNPPRDEIRRIRTQLQQYGQVGDANVFYWFQNRKSRSKHKQRHLQATRTQSRCTSSAAPLAATSAATSSSSSSSERSTGSDKTLPLPQLVTVGVVPAMVNDVPLAPVTPMSQSFFQQPQGEFSDESLLIQQGPQEYCFSTSGFASLVGVPDNGLGLCNGLFADLLNHERCKSGDEEAGLKVNLHHGYGEAAATAAAATTTTTTATTANVVTAATSNTAATTESVANIASATTDPIIDIIHEMGAGPCGATRSTAFINGVAFEVGTGPLNVREAFGEQAVLLHSSGHPVLLDEWGVTLHPLQHGASYYLV